MVAPALTPDDLVDAAVEVGAAAIEPRNDIGASSVMDADTARRIGGKAAGAGIEVVSVNALYPFNVWSEERARQTEALAALTAIRPIPKRHGLIAAVGESMAYLRDALAA